jgi:hypothetical protein
MKSKIPSLVNLQFIAAWSSLIGVGLLIFWLWPGPPNPVPKSVQSQAGFSIIYPVNYSKKTNGWQYRPSDKSVYYKVTTPDYSVVVTEEKVPLAYQDDQSAFDRFIGSLRPTSTFNSSLGSVSIVNFVTAGDYQNVGQSAILKAKGTLMIVHPSHNLSDDQWSDLFKSLKLSD